MKQMPKNKNTKALKKISDAKVRFLYNKENNTSVIKNPDDDDVLLKLINTFGSDDYYIANSMVQQISRVISKGKEFDEKEMNAAFAFINEIKARDTIEAMLAIQMLGTHLKSVHCLEKANLVNQTYEGETENINRATKLTRTFMAQMEALKKYRNKDGQKITVEHINVNDGGKAVIGSTINNIKDDIK